MSFCYRCMREASAKEDVCPGCHTAFTELPEETGDLLPGTLVGPEGRYMVGLRIARTDEKILYHCLDKAEDAVCAIYELLPVKLAFRTDGSSEPYLLPGVKPQDYARRMTRMQTQSQLMDRVRHTEGIEHVRDLFRANRTIYLVTDAPEGKPLTEELKAAGGKLTEERAFALTVQLLRLLGALHEENILCRAATPEHLWLKEERLSLRDLTDAAALPALSRLDPPRDEHYAAPEQRESRQEGPCTDLYQAGLCLHVMLAGALPERVEGVDVPDERLSEEARRVLGKLLAADPNDRPQSAADALVLLGQKEEPKTEPQPWHKLPWGAKLAAGLGAAAVLGFGAWYFLLRGGAAWVEELPEAMTLRQGAAVTLLLPDETELTIVSDNRALHVAQLGKQLIFRADSALTAQVRVESGRYSRQIRVSADEGMTGLAKERLSIYQNDVETVAYLADADAALECHVVPEGLAEAEAKAGRVTIRAGSAVGSGVVVVRAGETEHRIDLRVLRSPFVSALTSMEDQYTLYEGEEKDITPLTEGTAAFVLQTETASGGEHATLTQEGLRVLLRGKLAGETVFRVSDGAQTREFDVTVLPTFSALSASAITLYPDETPTITVLPKNEMLPAVTASSSDEKVLTVQVSGGTITLRPVSVGSCTVTVTDGYTTREAAVTVKVIPDRLDWQDLADTLELDAGSSTRLSLRAKSGTVPQVKCEHVSGADVAKIEQVGDQLTVTAQGVGQGVYALTDGEDRHDLTVTVQPYVQRFEKDQVKLVVGETTELAVETAQSGLTGVTFSAEPEGIVAFETTPAGKLRLTGGQVGSVQLTAGDGQRTVTTTVQVVNDLLGFGDLPAGLDIQPRLLGEEDLKKQDAALCVAAQEDLTLTFPLRTATGDTTGVQIGWVTTEGARAELTQDALVVSQLPLGGTGITLACDGKELRLWLEVLDHVTGLSEVPETMNADETLSLALTSASGSLIPTVDADGMTVQPPTSDHIVLTPTRTGDAAFTLSDGVNTWGYQLKVLPCLTGSSPAQVSAVSGQSKDAELHLDFALGSVFDVQVTGCEGLTWTQAGDVLTLHLPADLAPGSGEWTILPKEGVQAAQRSVTVAYTVEEPPEVDCLEQPVLLDSIYANQRIQVALASSSGSLVPKVTLDNEVLKITRLDAACIELEPRSVGSCVVTIADGVSQWEYTVQVLPCLQSVAPAEVTLRPGETAQISLRFRFSSEGEVAVTASGGPVEYQVEGSGLTVTVPEGTEPGDVVLEITDAASRAQGNHFIVTCHVVQAAQTPTPTPAQTLTQPQLPETLLANETITVTLPEAPELLELKDGGSLVSASRAGDALILTPVQVGSGQVTLGAGEMRWTYPLTVEPTLTGVSPKSLQFTSGAGQTTTLALEFALGTSMNVTAQDSNGRITFKQIGEQLRLTIPDMSGITTGEITLTAGGSITLPYTVTQAEYAVSAVKSAVLLGGRLYILDQDSGNVLRCELTGSDLRAVEEVGDKTAYRMVRSNGEALYGIDKYGTLVLFGDASRYTTDYNISDQTAQIMGLSFEEVLDARMTDSAVLLLLGGTDPTYSEYALSAKDTVKFGPGSCVYWTVTGGDLSGEGKPVSKGKLSQRSILTDLRAIDLCGTGAIALGEKNLWIWGADNTMADALGVKRGLNTATEFKVRVDKKDVVPDGDLVALGPVTAAVTMSDGRLLMTGQNDLGQLGQGNTDKPKNWVTVPLPQGRTVKQVLCRLDSTLALLDNGDLYGWGSNVTGQLGLTVRGTVSTPTLMYRGVAQISQGDSLLLVTQDGGVVQLKSGSFEQMNILR